MSRRYAIIGCGAVGGYYGGCLARAGVETHFLLHRDYDHVRAQGLRVDSPTGDFVLPRVNAYRSPRELPPCDVAIVALKTTQNGKLPELIPPVLRAGGTVLMLQNGLGEEPRVAGLPGVGEVLAGLCFLCSNKIGPGHIRHVDYGYIALASWREGGRAAGITAAMQDIAADFGRAGIRIEQEPDLLAARWKKLVWNIPYNGLAVVCKADTRQLMADSARRPRIVALMREVVAAARADGHPVPDGFIERMLAQTEKMAPYEPSMKLDYDAHRPMELEAMYAAPLARGRALGVAMPEIERLLAELRERDVTGGS